MIAIVTRVRTVVPSKNTNKPAEAKVTMLADFQVMAMLKPE
jgi:hypothetical protein